MADKGKGKGGKKGGNKKEKNKKPDSPVDSDTPQAAEPKLKALRSVEVQEGKKAILRCEVIAGQPIANFKWYKNGKELAGKNKPKDVKIKNKKNKKSSELHFRKTAESNAGSYTCEAINDHGKDTAVGDLTVIKAVTSTTLSLRTSSHEKQCSEKDSSYCVNGGLCFTVEVTPGTNKLFCRCLPGYSGNRCQVTVPMKVMNRTQAEELYQKRVLTITGICIALLVVGIMCVVAYCKTKKQRKKLHDRLRQSLRTERHTMASMANGPQVFQPPRDNVQLVNQYVSKNSMSAEHIIEKETETSFSTSQCTPSAHHSTTITHTSSQSWSDGLGESVPSDCHSVLVRPSAENSKHATPSSRRERLNATGCSRDLSALKNSRNTPDSFKDSPYSEKYVSAMTTPSRMSPVEPISPLSPKSPKSPPSEMSPPLSSLTISVPSVAVSPQGEEERPLLFSTPPRLREKQRLDHGHSHSDQYQRNSAHYNHGQTHSPPPSPQRTAEEDEYETTQEYETAAPQPSKKLANGQRAKRTKPNDHVVQKLESNSDSSSESSSSESETEDERVGEDTPFLSIQNPLAASLESAPTFRPADSSRTNPGLRLSTQEDLQARLSNVMANQDPIAV